METLYSATGKTYTTRWNRSAHLSLLSSNLGSRYYSTMGRAGIALRAAT